MSYYPKYITEDPSVPLLPALVSLAIVIGLLLVMRRQSDTRYEPADADRDAKTMRNKITNFLPWR